MYFILGCFFAIMHIYVKKIFLFHACVHSQKLLEAEKFASSYELYSIKYYLMFIVTSGPLKFHKWDATTELHGMHRRPEVKGLSPSFSYIERLQ